MKEFTVYFRIIENRTNKEIVRMTTIKAIDKYQAIAKVQQVCSIYKGFSIIKVRETAESFWYKVRNKGIKIFYKCAKCGNCVSEPTIKCSGCGASMSIWKEI